ncbi:putative fumarylacetoacetate hydrolase [Phaeosphaeriaceae sp. PMI808]|nr:putative fumarylacetoacetate hydrolase [Phaeosphaeriaceae sp. PMI808]
MCVNFPVPIPEGSPFPLQNIPFGIFSRNSDADESRNRHAATAIGDYVLDLGLLAEKGFFQEVEILGTPQNVFAHFAQLPSSKRRRARNIIIELLSTEKSALFTDVSLKNKAFIPSKNVTLYLPVRITDYTDSLCSLVHLRNCLGPSSEDKTPPQFYQFPLAYHGRVGGVAVSGTDFARPAGLFPDDSGKITYQPSQALDYEIGIGTIIAEPLKKGKQLDAKSALDHVFGFTLHNDWSARDLQRYEMAYPVTVFHSKSFLTSMSPWVVTPEALRGCVAAPPLSNSTDIHPILECDEEKHGLYNIELAGKLTRNGVEKEIARVYMKDSYWSPAQLVAYHSLSGCGLNTGDLLSMGTISSSASETCEGNGAKDQKLSVGCLAEAKMMGINTPTFDGKPLVFLEDGDRFTIQGWFRAADGVTAGFGDLTSVVLPSGPL